MELTHETFLQGMFSQATSCGSLDWLFVYFTTLC